jgi:hypothetical protein
MEATLGCRLSAIAVFVVLSACGPSERERGEALFAGTTSVVARMAGHDTVLPGSASRCTNCHGLKRASSPASGATFGATFGPTLSARFLLDARSRRGGPASRFDVASLCRMLRTGVDPASIVIARSMPLYEFSDRDCAALWAYLSSD